MLVFSNNAAGILATEVSPGDLVLTLEDASAFPDAGEFLATLTQFGIESSWEIVRCTDRTGDTLTVVRAQEGTAAQAWPAGSKVELRLTAGALTEFVQRGEAASRRIHNAVIHGIVI